jgi:hypothetical protein
VCADQQRQRVDILRDAAVVARRIGPRRLHRRRACARSSAETAPIAWRFSVRSNEACWLFQRLLRQSLQIAIRSQRQVGIGNRRSG